MWCRGGKGTLVATTKEAIRTDRHYVAILMFVNNVFLMPPSRMLVGMSLVEVTAVQTVRRSKRALGVCGIRVEGPGGASAKDGADF
jgi:hypothetical protein